MLYEAYQAHNDILGPIRLMAEAFRGFFDQPWPLVGDAPFIRGAAAAMEMLSNAGISHDRPNFGIRSVTIEGREVAVTEEIVATHPFCKLLHFRKDCGPRRAYPPGRRAALRPLSDLVAGHRPNAAAGARRLYYRLGERAERRAPSRPVRSGRLRRSGDPIHPPLGTAHPCYGGVPAFGAGVGRRIVAGGGRRSLPTGIDDLDGWSDRPEGEPDRGQSLCPSAFAWLVRAHGYHDGARRVIPEHFAGFTRVFCSSSVF